MKEQEKTRQIKQTTKKQLNTRKKTKKKQTNIEKIKTKHKKSIKRQKHTEKYMKVKRNLYVQNVFN